MPPLLLGLTVLFGPTYTSASFLLPPLAFAQTAGPEYVVEPGDTLFAIAQRFGTTVDELEAANPGVQANALIVGGHLIIPGFPSVSGTLQFHEVEFGETFDSIARRFNIAPADLVRLNRIVNPKTVYLGQSIVYAEGSAPPQTAGRRSHILPEGGTLIGLAAATGQNPWALAALNQLASPALSLAGHPILVPDPTVAGASGLPAPFTSLNVIPPVGVHGQTLEIMVGVSEPATLSGQFSRFGAVTPPADLSPQVCLYPTRNLHFAEAGDSFVALQGLCAASTAEGEEPPTSLFAVEVTATSQTGNVASFSQLIRIDPAYFPKDPPLHVNAETLEPAVEQPEVDAVRQAASGFTPTRMWQGVFLSPSQGEFKSCFGARRSYNDGPYNRYHAGVDFSGHVGTPILAPAPGTVVLAEPNFVVYGGITIVDHGWGVYSAYLHQSKIEVAIGDKVEPGQEIGQVGNTGRAQGPHLHWEIWVGGVPVDPLDWLNRTIPSDTLPVSPRACFEGF